MPYKTPRIGIYGDKERSLQKRLSYEKTSMSYHPVNIYRYLGSAINTPNAAITDIQSPLWLETNDRDYDSEPVMINAHVEQLQESSFDLTRFGIISPLQDVQLFKIHVNSFDPDQLGRYLIVGDVIEVPFWEKDGIKAFFEITDVDRKTEFENFHVTVTCEPIKDSQEMEEISDIPTNSDVLDTLQSSLDTEFEKDVVNVGINVEFDLYVTRGYVIDDYVDPLDTFTYQDENQFKTTYDPRHDLSEGFLDNPDATVF